MEKRKKRLTAFINKIICMDCLDYIKQIPYGSIDLIILDPPYNIRKADWDKIEDYESFLNPILKECKRVLKDFGSIYIFGNTERMAYIQIIADKLFDLRNLIIWKKSNHKANLNWKEYRKFSPMTESLLFYIKVNNFTSEIQQIHSDTNNFKKIKGYFRLEKGKSGYSNEELSKLFSKFYSKIGNENRSIIEHYFSNKDWRFPTKEIYTEILQKTGYFTEGYDLLYNEYKKEYDLHKIKLNYFNPKEDFTNVWISNIITSKEKVNHPTQKPLWLIKRIIETSTNKEDLVLDCFMGSGTTALACQQLGRNFIGCDNKEEYVKLANERLSQRSLEFAKENRNELGGKS